MWQTPTEISMLKKVRDTHHMAFEILTHPHVQDGPNGSLTATPSSLWKAQGAWVPIALASYTESLMVSDGIGCRQHNVDNTDHRPLPPQQDYREQKRLTKLRSRRPEPLIVRESSATAGPGAAMEYNRGSTTAGGVWRRSFSKLSATVKRQLSCKSLADEEDDERVMEATHSYARHGVRNAISLDDRDDESDYKLERVRLSLVGLTSSDEFLELPAGTHPTGIHVTSPSRDIRAITRGTGSRDTGDHSGAMLGTVNASEESIDILEDHDELQSGRYSGVLESLRSKAASQLTMCNGRHVVEGHHQ